MSAGINLGATTKKVVGFLAKASFVALQKEKMQLFTTPSVVEEIGSFFDEKDQSVLHELLRWVTVKAPSIHELVVPAGVMLDYVGEGRERAYRGLSIAEEEIRTVGKQFMGKEVMGEKQFQIAVGSIIRTLRDRYRNATRNQYIDSVADFELIMLTKEIGGELVSTDAGVMRWARMMGVVEMSPAVFGKEIRAYCASE